MTISEAFKARIVSLMGERKAEKTIKNYRCAEKSLLAAVGDIPIELFGSQQLAIWNLHMKQCGYSETYIQTQYAKLKSVLSFLLDNDMQVMNPRKIKSPARDTAPRTVLTTQEVQSLISACKSPRDKAMVALTFLTGARPFEVLSITKDQYLDAEPDDKGRKEVVVLGKGQKYRHLPLGITAQKYVDAYLDTRRNPKTGRLDYYKPLFMSGQCRQITLSRFEQILHQAAQDAGLDKVVTPYILRHSFATDLLENEAPIEHVSKILGHSSVAMTSKVYSHVNTEVQKDTVDKYLTAIE